MALREADVGREPGARDRPSVAAHLSTCGRVSPCRFRIKRCYVDALDVIAQLGITHAPLTDVGWWCQRGQGHLFASLLEQFIFVDDALGLRAPSEASSLAHGFDLKRLVARTLGLLPLVTLDMSRPGKERVVYSTTERSVDYGRREDDWRPIEGYCYGKEDAAAQGLKTVPDWDDDDDWQGHTQVAKGCPLGKLGIVVCWEFGGSQW